MRVHIKIPALFSQGTWQKGSWKAVGSQIPEGHCETVCPEQAAQRGLEQS